MRLAELLGLILTLAIIVVNSGNGEKLAEIAENTRK